MSDSYLDKILFEFNNSNFKKAYSLAINVDQKHRNEDILKVLVYSSFNLKNYTEAIKFGLDLIRIPNSRKNIQILNIIGTSYSIIGDFINGSVYFNEYLKSDPENISVRYNLGLNFFNQKKYKESENQFVKVIDINSDYKDSKLFYGMIQSELKNYEKAIDIFSELLSKNKYIGNTNYNLGVTYQKKRDYMSSIKYLERAINFDSNQYQYFNSLGISYQKLFSYEKAKNCYVQAIKLNENYTNAYSNLGLLNQKNGRFKEALDFYNIALQKDPKDYDILYNKSICLLQSGNYKEGLKYYKFRQSGNFLQNKKFNLNNIKNKKILVTCDQGLGDTILLSRFVKLLPSYGAKVTFQIPKSMTELMRYLDDNICITSEDALNNFDYECALGDLLEIFDFNNLNIPSTKSYLKIDKKWVDKWKIKLNKNKFNVGIAWQGKAGSTLDEGRSFELKNFETISKIDNISLISLQKNDGLEQIEEFSKKNKITNFDSILDQEVKFMDTAGLMKSLDLVITSDTSIVHLAGALGINVWLLLQKYPFWYWNSTNQKSIWYDSIKVFKQDQNHNWTDLFIKIENELRKIA